jgi:branched-chain amino acid transport system substrate-binding protein
VAQEPGKRSGRAGRRRTAIIGGLAALALVAAACGDDDDSGADAEATDSAAESATQPEGTPIRVGVFMDQSSVQSATNAGVRPVLEAWEAHTNSEGGVAERPVELVFEDTKADAPTGTSVAQGFIDDDSIDAMVVFDPSTEAAIGELVSSSGLPVVGGVGYLPTVWGALPNWFGITTSFPSVVNKQLVSAQEVGAEVVASAPCAEVSSCKSAAPVFEAAADTLGLELAGSIDIASDAPNYTAECLQFIDEGAEFIQLAVNQATGVRLAADCEQQGYEGWFGASAGAVGPELYHDVSRLTGGLNAFPWFADAEPVQNFRDVMDDQGVSEDEYGMPTATGAWATMELFRTTLDANAAGLSEDVTRDEVVAAYGTVADETLDGLLPQPITFQAGQPAPPVDCFWLYTAEGGEISGAFEPTCPPAEFAAG